MPSVPAASGLVKPFRSFPGRGATQSREPGNSRGMRNENQCPGRKMGLPRAGSRARGSCGMRWPQPPPWPGPGAGVRSPTAGQVATPGRARGTGSRSRAPERPRYLPGGRLRAVSSPGLPDVRQDGCDLPGRPGTMGPGGPAASLASPERPPSGTSSGRALTAARQASGGLCDAGSLTLSHSGRPTVPLIRPGNAGRRAAAARRACYRQSAQVPSTSRRWLRGWKFPASASRSMVLPMSRSKPAGRITSVTLPQFTHIRW